MKAHKRQLLASLMSVAFTLGAHQVAAELIVSDSFESGDMSAPGYNGFSWSQNDRTSIVSSDGVLWSNGPKSIDKPSGRDWEPYRGENSLRFRYPSGSNMAEQQFSMEEGHPELWMSFWLKVPINFHHTSGNQKLFRLWMDAYEGEGSKVGMEFRPNGNGGSNFYLKLSDGNYSAVGGDTGTTEFIETPRDLGRWMHIVFRVSSETAPGASDGIVEVWRSWADQTEYEKTHFLENQKIMVPSDGPKGFKHGYLMGWANGAYSKDTEFLIDNFTLSTESILGEKPCPPGTNRSSLTDGCN